MNYLGIDPGLSGGIAFIPAEFCNRKFISAFDIPVIVEKLRKSKKRRYDINAIVKLMIGFKEQSIGGLFVVLERSQAMPKQGVTSMFSIGFGFGLYQGILSGLNIKYEIAGPRKWQKLFFTTGDTKAKAFQVASRMFPEVELQTKRGRILDGRCDALLIAEYARRIYTNE